MTVGTPPGTGPQLVDGLWLQGLAGGLNQTYVSGLVANNAASQATATSIPSGISLAEVDTSVANGSLVLPDAIAGTEVSVINNTANTLNIYANAAINQTTGVLDTINALANASPFTGATGNTITWFACAKNGKWYTK